MLGLFEHKVMTAIQGLDENAYGVTIKKHISDEFSKNASYGALYTTLSRLEKKGYVTSKMGQPQKVRGGRAKKYYQLTADGHRELAEFQRHMERMYNLDAGGLHA